MLPSGVVTSPNYPTCNYPNNLNTTETISVKEGMVVVLEVILLQMLEGNVKEVSENPIIKVGEEP